MSCKHYWSQELREVTLFPLDKQITSIIRTVMSCFLYPSLPAFHSQMFCLLTANVFTCVPFQNPVIENEFLGHLVVHTKHIMWPLMPLWKKQNCLLDDFLGLLFQKRQLLLFVPVKTVLVTLFSSRCIGNCEKLHWRQNQLWIGCWEREGGGIVMWHGCDWWRLCTTVTWQDGRKTGLMWNCPAS